MAEEEKEKSQEELAKEWEEALKQQEEKAEEGDAEKESAGEGAQSEEDIMAAWEEALAQQESPSQEKEEPQQGCSDEKYELLKDIPLEITVEIGSTELPLEEILKLHPNSVVELDRFIEDPVDIKINGKLVAKGKLYVVKENFGVEIVQIITPEERLKLIEE